MADIANIGFRAETSDLADAKAKLDALPPAAGRAERAAEKLTQAAAEAGNAMHRAAAGATAAGSAMGSAASGANASGAAVGAAGAAAGRSAGFWTRLTDQIKSYLGMAGRVPAAAAATRVAVNDNAGAMKANVGNIAAQFQDIGVTAAMGMSPMMIALQQGTQLAAVFSQTGGGAFKALAGAIGQVLSPTSLLTIGFVGLLAAVFQTVDWIALAKSALNGLADIMQSIAPYAVLLAAGLALIYSPAIIAGIWSVVTGLYGIATGLLATIGLPALLVIGLVAIVAAAVHFRDSLTKMFGFDIVGAAKNGINFIIGGFVGAFNAIRKTWRSLPAVIGDATMSAANMVISGTAKMINGAIGLLNKLLSGIPSFLTGGKTLKIGAVEFGSLANPWAGEGEKFLGTLSSEIQAAQKVDYVGKGIAGVQAGAKWLGDKMRGLASGLGADSGKKKHGGKGDTGDTGGKTDAEKFSDIASGAQRDIASVQAEINGIDLTAEAAARLKNEQKLLNEAQQKGIKLTDPQRAELMKLAGTLSDLQVKLANLKGFKEIKEGAERSLEALKAEAGEIGLYGEALARAKYEQQLLNEAKQKNITLTDQQRAQIGQYAAALAAQDTANTRDKFYQTALDNADKMRLGLAQETAQLGMNEIALARAAYEQQLLNSAIEQHITLTPQQIADLKATAAELAATDVQLRHTKEALDFAKGATRGFLGDLMQGAREGKNVFETFGNAVLNVLDKILDKMLDVMTNAMFEQGNGSGGILGFITKALSLSFSGGNGGGWASGVGSSADMMGDPFAGFAKGSAFGSRGIVSSPTMFSFAKGTALGQMGEAGPEGILPLSRGPDGSLGVQMYGTGGAAAPVVNNVDIHQHFHVDGAISSDDVQALVRQGAREAEKSAVTSVRRGLAGMLQQLQNDGAIV